ncbi:kinase [Caulobacter segnis]|uniref:kinase n=1 Tax=Caulobacter segnis TaxID=88688 RepID=UPI00240F940E|nr:kinase [Caulobacter segnis]MDG2521555.1 kinase [Caulobacter segnis]
MTGSLEAVEAALDGWRADSPFILGLCGAQGSGKSTLAAGLVDRLAARGLRAAALSIDDLYLSHEARRQLAEDVHPLFATRGPPGTHDLALGLSILDGVKAGRPVTLPGFDKSTDDPTPEDAWRRLDEPLDVLIFEGWCVGARPQAEHQLIAPANALEARADPQGVWRRQANSVLGGAYAALFSRVDRLVLLAAPGFEVVRRWRLQQEEGLGRQSPGGTRLMNAEEIAVFIQHYERLTRHILATMPAYADLVLWIDEARRLRSEV